MWEKLKCNMCKKSIILIDFLVVLFSYSLFLNDTFSSDSLSLYMSGNDINSYFNNGRFTLGIFFGFLDLINFDSVENQFISQMIKILACSIFVFFISLIFEQALPENKKNKFNFLLINLCFLIAVVNPYYTETFVFVSPDWGIGLLLVLLSVFLFSEKKYISAFICSFISVSAYQVWIFCILILVFSYLLVKNDFDINYSVLKEYFIVGFLSVLAAGVNLFINRLGIALGFLDEVKSVGINNIYDKIKEIILCLKYTFNNVCGMMPEKFLFLFFILVCLLLGYGLFYKKNRWRRLIWTYFIIGVMILTPFMIAFVQRVPYFPSRIIFPVFFAIASSAVLVVVGGRDNTFKGYGIIVGIYLIVSWWNVELLCLDHYVSNQLDFEYARIIEQKIENYESDTGYEIEKIEYYNVKNYVGQYYRETMLNSSYYTRYNIRLYFDEWGVIPTLNYVNGENYIGENMSEEKYKQIFKGKQWEEIDLDNQILFDENTMYWAVF